MNALRDTLAVRILVYVVFVVGTAYVCSLVALGFANRLEQPFAGLLELAVVALGGWYGFVNARKWDRRRSSA